MIEDLVLIDWISVALLATFGITGLFNGFIKELFSEPFSGKLFNKASSA